jgi:hypothetical protein
MSALKFGHGLVRLGYQAATTVSQKDLARSGRAALSGHIGSHFGGPGPQMFGSLLKILYETCGASRGQRDRPGAAQPSDSQADFVLPCP